MVPMWEMDDDLVIEELKAAMSRPHDVPPEYVEAAKAAFAWRDIDAELELLTLAYDSSLAETAGIRRAAPASERVLVFEGEDVTMTLEVGPEVLMGQVVPARSDTVVMEVAAGPVQETVADDSGFFLLRRPAAGPVRLKWTGDGVHLVTEWVTI